MFEIGDKVIKKSGKPFQSTFKVNTVNGFVLNPWTNKPSLVFLEDNSVVEEQTCIKLENIENRIK